LVILPSESPLLRRPLSVRVLTVEHNNLQGVLDSYLIIGELFGEDILATARQKRQELLDKLNTFKERIQNRIPLRTLIVIDRSHGTGRIQHLFVAGANSFLTEVITMAGGENVAASIGLLAPQLSAEGVIHLAPEVIIDIQIPGRDLSRSASDWQSLGINVSAVRNNRILTLTDDFASIPGPRTPMLIEKIAQYFESIEP
jgi:iron complex transport system substrate-binding protein